MEAPNPKHQIPKKILMTKIQKFETNHLVLKIDLEFIWDL